MNVNTWASYDGKWYLFNEFGEVQTGWTYTGGRWYYMDEHGVQQKGWITYDKNKYYLNDELSSFGKRSVNLAPIFDVP